VNGEEGREPEGKAEHGYLYFDVVKIRVAGELVDVKMAVSGPLKERAGWRRGRTIMGICERLFSTRERLSTASEE